MTQDQTQALVDRLRAVRSGDPVLIGSIIVDLCDEAADLIERQSRIIAAHEQQVKDGAELLAAKDAEIERLARDRDACAQERDEVLTALSNETRRADAAVAERNAAVEMMNNAAAALGEATAILGGEYGDHHATLCDRMMQLDEDIASFRSRPPGGNET